MKQDFQILYGEFYEKLFKVAYRLTGKKEDAEDIIQEAFLSAYKYYPKFLGNSSALTWLYKIVVNCAYRYLKKQKKLPIENITSNLNMKESDFFESLQSNESVEDVAIADDIRETCLQMFIDCMPKKQRIAFVLKVILNLSIEDIASIMNISKSDVKINIYRARKNMRENMEGRCSFINPNNPCSCKLWAYYAIKNNKTHLIPNNPYVNKINYDEILNSDIDCLSKLVIIYNSNPEPQSYEKFIKSIEDLIAEKSLKLLS